ncbi:hypothetical protein ACOKS3_17510 [Pseudomonas sp. HS6-2]|uniref:hypothetical protein n=1 Tax=Pseudomonas sp. HS6-2 TaxID=3410986 RepID=UPI003BDEF53A
MEVILEKEPAAGYRLVALLEEIAGSQDLMEKLSWDHYGGQPHAPEQGASMSVAKWLNLYRKGLNIWRLRDFELSRLGHEYRVIYAFIPAKDLYFVLAVVERAFNYDPSHPVTQRVYSAYKRLEADGW